MPLKKCSGPEIVLDGRMMQYSGIGTYIRGLIGEFRKHPFFKDHSLGLALSRSVSPDGLSLGERFPFSSPVYSIREQLEYPFRIRRCRLWHAPHYNIPLFKRRVRLVVTVHDLIHWIFRKEFYSSLQAVYARFFFRSLVQLADRIVTVSGQTRKDLIEYFEAPPERIRVIYEGVSSEYFRELDPEEKARVLQKYKLPKRFFLYVGLLKPHKNVKRLVEIFTKLRNDKKLNSSLVLVGRKDRRYPRGFEMLKELQTNNGLYYLPQVASQKELSCLYRAALALVHPSLYEGFGLTCLEAMASGTPVIVSKVASLPEVVGEAGYYVDPHSVDSIREALLGMEKNETLRKELAEKARARASQFSWAKAAEETIRVYQEVLD